VRAAIRRMLKVRAAPRTLCVAVEEFIESNTLLARHGINEATVLASLPPPIKLEVAVILHSKLLAMSPVFSGTPKQLISEVARMLRYRCLVTGDMACSEDDLVLEAILIHSGCLYLFREEEGGEEGDLRKELETADKIAAHAIAVRENDVDGSTSSLPHTGSTLLSATAQRGDLVGYEMFLGRRVGFSAVAVAVTEVYVLHKRDFKELIRAFPEHRQDIEAQAERHLELLAGIFKKAGA
jgi:CRP-like cAMP-binding protein